jgi:hypothetical protein
LRPDFSTLSLQPIEAVGVVFLFRLSELPALRECVREQSVISRRFFDPGKEALKVVLEQMLK